jgi:TfoX/Sxy family transcriptional regulator of competence genes
MFGGLFAHSIMVKLSPEHQKEALALDGAAPFDPMGNGRVMGNTVMLPDSVMDDPAEMKMWLQRGYDYVSTLPAKKKKPAAKKPATRTVKRAQKRKR